MTSETSNLFTQDGFLINFEDWSKDIAKERAKLESIELTNEHWVIIFFLREFYASKKKSPAIRLLVRALKEKFGDSKGNSINLQTLFPDSPALQAAKISGLPRPKRCI